MGSGSMSDAQIAYSITGPLIREIEKMLFEGLYYICTTVLMSEEALFATLKSSQLL